MSETPLHEPDPGSHSESDVDALYRRWTVRKLFYFPLRLIGFGTWVYIAHELIDPLTGSGFRPEHWKLLFPLGGVLALYVLCSYLWQCPRCRRRFWIGWRWFPLFSDYNRCPKCEFQLIR